MGKFFAIIKPDEDGRTFRHVLDVSELLADPKGEAGISVWKDGAFLGANPDPQYWVEGTAVLVECEVVVPKPAGAYVLP